MNRNRAFVLFVAAILLVFTLTACTRSLRTPPPTTPTAPGGGSAAVTPSNPTQVMEQINAFATQTAMVANMTTPGVIPTEVPPQPTEQPGGPAPTLPPPVIQQATPTQIVVPPPTPGVPATYTIQKGEFPFCIARRFNVDIGELLRINGLGPNSLVFSGTVLKMPQSGSPFNGQRALRPHPATYTVRAGDTIYSVACYYGSADPNSIAFANQLTAPYNLTPGQLLNIP